MFSAPAEPGVGARRGSLLEFLIIAFDAPTQLGDVDQTMEGDAFGKGREPIFGRLFLFLGPLDQQPFFRSALGEIVITMRNSNSQACEA